MKKTLIFVLSLTLLFMVLGANAYANETPNDAADVAKQYISWATRNMYLYEKNDLDSLSVASLSPKIKSSEIVYWGDNQVSSIDLVEDIKLVSDKVEYYKYVREAQECIVNDFCQTYTVIDEAVNGDIAIVKIEELLMWQYDDYYLPSGARIEYEVTLVNTGNNWLVAKVIAPNEYFDQKYIIGDTEFNLAEALTSFDEKMALEQEIYETYLTDLAENSTEKVEPLATNKSYSYDADKAVAYARKWALGRNIGNGSDRFLEFSKDCMNFASQCVYAGLGGSETTHDTEYMDKSGSEITERWYWNDYESWCSCSDFRNYVSNDNSNSINLKTDIYEIAVGGQLPFWVDPAGSVAHVNSNVQYGHAIFITDYESLLLKDLYFCAHTSDRLNEKYGAHYADSPAYIIVPSSLDK